MTRRCKYCGSEKYYAKGYCRPCYARSRRDGSPEYNLRIVTEEEVREWISLLLTMEYKSLTEIAAQVDRDDRTLRNNLRGDTEIGKDVRESLGSLSVHIDYALEVYSMSGGKTLSPADVARLLQDRESGMSIYQLAEKYEIDPAHAYKIIDGQKHSYTSEDHLWTFLRDTVIKNGTEPEEEQTQLVTVFKDDLWPEEERDHENETTGSDPA